MSSRSAGEIIFFALGLISSSVSGRVAKIIARTGRHTKQSHRGDAGRYEAHASIPVSSDAFPSIASGRSVPYPSMRLCRPVATRRHRHRHHRGAPVGRGGSRTSCLLARSFPFYGGPLCNVRNEMPATQKTARSFCGVELEEGEKNQRKHKRHTCKLLRPLLSPSTTPPGWGQLFLLHRIPHEPRFFLSEIPPILWSHRPHRHPGGCIRTHGGEGPFRCLR